MRLPHGSWKSSPRPVTRIPSSCRRARTAFLSSTTSPKWRAPSGGCERPAASATNWSPRSMKAMCRLRPRSSSGPKIESQNASASSMSPTSRATWLIPTSFIPELHSSHRCRTCEVEGRPLDESELIARAQRGDATAYEELVHAYQGIAFRTAYLITGGAAEAEDAAQEAFVKAWRALGRFRSGAPFRPWLLRIVANEAHNRRRSAGRRAQLALRAATEIPSGDAAPSPEAALLGAEQREWLLEVVNGLPDDQRVVISPRRCVRGSSAGRAGAARLRSRSPSPSLPSESPSRSRRRGRRFSAFSTSALRPSSASRRCRLRRSGRSSPA